MSDNTITGGETMKRYEPTIEWSETESLGRVTASVRLRESVIGSVAKVEEVVDELNAARCEAAQSQVDLVEARRERDLMHDQRDDIRAELCVLRDALRTVAEFYQAGVPIGALPIGRCLAALTPEQRAACGWPDPKPDPTNHGGGHYHAIAYDDFNKKWVIRNVYDAVLFERDTLREAMRKYAPLIREHRGRHDHMMGMLMSRLTPEQRAACGWPDPEPPKRMTWDEALSALKDGKQVSRRGKLYWGGGLYFNESSELRFGDNNVPVLVRDDFDATDWEVVP